VVSESPWGSVGSFFETQFLRQSRETSCQTLPYGYGGPIEDILFFRSGS